MARDIYVEIKNERSLVKTLEYLEREWIRDPENLTRYEFVAKHLYEYFDSVNL